MRTTRFSLAALAILFLFTLSARASPVAETISIQGDGTELTGSFISAGGYEPLGSFNYFDGTNNYLFDFSQLTGSDTDGDYAVDIFTNTAGDRFYLGILEDPPPTTSVAVICSNANPCSTGGEDPSAFISFVNPNGTDDQHFVSAGDLVFGDPSTVPEPSSLVLLGTGVLGAFGAARRRFTL